MTDTDTLLKIKTDITSRINRFDLLLEYKYTLSGLGHGASVSDIHDANTRKKECQSILGMITRLTNA